MDDGESSSAGWSGDVPITPAPIDFVFADPTSPGTRRDGVDPRRERDRDPHREQVGQHDSDRNVDTPHRRRWLVPTVVTVGLVGAVLAVGAMRDGAVDEANTDLSPASSPPTTWVPTTVRTIDASPSPSTADQPATTVPVDEGLPAAWRTQAVALPERIRATATPMRIFALARSGVLYDIDVQTGTMQSLDLGTTLFSAQLHVARSSVLITNDTSSNDPVLVPDGGQPIEIPLGSPSGGTYIEGVASNGTDYVGESWNAREGTSSRLFVRTDGTVDEVERRDAGWRPGGGSVTGEELIADAGGMYLESPDGATRRISEGVPVAVSSASVLARECDEQRRCGYVIIDLVDEDRAVVAVPEGFSFDDGLFWNMVLAPDGHAVLVSSQSFSGVAALFVDLLDGTSTPVSVEVDDGPNGAMWASDSSGVFTTDQGKIVFVDAATGEVTAVPLDGDGDDDIAIVDVAIRHAT